MTNAAAGESGAFEIVVASLASAVERRRRVEAMLAGSPWKWRLFDACTTPREDIPYDERAARIQRGRALSRAEVCTFATHYTILRDFAEGAGEGCLMVLEDDVLIEDTSELGEDDITRALQPDTAIQLLVNIVITLSERLRVANLR